MLLIVFSISYDDLDSRSQNSMIMKHDSCSQAEISVISKFENLLSETGWFAGRGLAISQVTTKYFIWMDNDLRVTENTNLEKLLEIIWISISLAPCSKCMWIFWIIHLYQSYKTLIQCQWLVLYADRVRKILDINTHIEFKSLVHS